MEADPIKGTAVDHHALSFRLRQQNAPDIITEHEIKDRMDGASFLRASGNEFFRAKNTQEAAQTYARALEHLQYCPPQPAQRAARDAERLLIYLNLAACHLALKDYRPAERFCSRALEIDRNSVKGLYRRAKASLLRKDPIRKLRFFVIFVVVFVLLFFSPCRTFPPFEIQLPHWLFCLQHMRVTTKLTSRLPPLHLQKAREGLGNTIAAAKDAERALELSVDEEERASLLQLKEHLQGRKK